MKPEPMLMIPGPTPVPQEVMVELSHHPVGHRSGEFKALLNAAEPRLQWLYQTKRPVYVYTSSGTGAMEAALINTLSPDDSILVLSCGVFSDRFGDIGKALGLTVHKQEVEHGQPNVTEDLEAFLKGPEGKAVKAVCMIHNETSTGVLNPIEEFARIIRQHSDALIIVDTITGLGAAPFKFDDWGIDIAVSGSQKGFMLPPGLAVIAVSERALSAHQKTQNPGYYFNFSAYEKQIVNGQTPWTPAVTLIRGLEKALELMESEGLDGLHKRHRENRRMVREAIKALGLEPLVSDDRYASFSVTSIKKPDDVTIDDLRAGLKNEFNLTFANGQKGLKGKIFRIGHLGAIYSRDVLTGISCLEVVLNRLGHTKAPLGTGIAAAQQALLASETREALV